MESSIRLLFFSASSASPATQQEDATMAPDVQTLFQASVQKRLRNSELRRIP
jgi:hypothetical protein